MSEQAGYIHLVTNEGGDYMFATPSLASLTPTEASKYSSTQVPFYGERSATEGRLMFNDAEQPVAVITKGVSALDVGIKRHAAFTRYITIKQGEPYADR